MQEEMLNIHNGQSLAIARVPILTEPVFRQKIIAGVSRGLRLINLFGCVLDDGEKRIFSVLGNDAEGKLSISSFHVTTEKGTFKSLTPEVPQAHLFEREIAEQYGIIFEGHPWMKPVRCHNSVSDKPEHEGYPFYQLHGDEIHEVAVGPVHAGIIEPGHFRFQCLGEEIIHLEIRLGYQHRGVEKMMEQCSRERGALLAESIAGDTVIGHVSAWCNLMESLSGCEISHHAEAIRAIALELERLANHTGDLGALCADIGFLPSSAYFGRLRGVFLNLSAELSGNRFGRSLCYPGGVVFDLDEEMLKDFHRQLLIAQKDLNEIAQLMFDKPSVLARLEGTGIVSQRVARDLGLVGPAARASGCKIDVRTDYAFGRYRFCHIPISTILSGDVYARALVRWFESQRSIEFILNSLNDIPRGALRVEAGALKPNHIALAMVEGWRGEIMHIALTDNASRIMRYKIKDPSFHNWPALGMAVRNAQISDFPLCNKSFNLSYAGHDL